MHAPRHSMTESRREHAPRHSMTESRRDRWRWFAPAVFVTARQDLVCSPAARLAVHDHLRLGSRPCR